MKNPHDTKRQGLEESEIKMEDPADRSGKISELPCSAKSLSRLVVIHCAQVLGVRISITANTSRVNQICYSHSEDTIRERCKSLSGP